MIAALNAIHSDRGVTAEVSADPQIAAACDPQDFDEMSGNLLDNAFKWARGRIVVTAQVIERDVALTIEDDGPGLPDALWPEAVLPGRRLDEATPGHGFGLSIARELAELYGGSIRLSRSGLGGLSVRLAIPNAG